MQVGEKPAQSVVQLVVQLCATTSDTSDVDDGERLLLLANFNDAFLECRRVECVTRAVCVCLLTFMDDETWQLTVSIAMGVHRDHIALADELLSQTAELPAELLDVLAQVRAFYRAQAYAQQVVHAKDSFLCCCDASAALQGGPLAHIPLRALWNLSFGAACAQQVVACNGVETLVAILPATYPAAQVLALRVLEQVTTGNRDACKRLSSRRSLTTLLRVLESSEEKVGDGEDERQADARMKQQQMATAVPDALLRLVDALSRHPRFEPLARTGGDDASGTRLLQQTLVVRVHARASASATHARVCPGGSSGA